LSYNLSDPSVQRRVLKQVFVRLCLTTLGKRECGSVSLKNYTHEELTDMAMVELANVILEDANKALDFREVFNKLAELKRYTEEQKHDLLAQFYTELNIDGRFLTLGSDKWGLKRWYPVDQIDEQVVAEP